MDLGSCFFLDFQRPLDGFGVPLGTSRYLQLATLKWLCGCDTSAYGLCVELASLQVNVSRPFQRSFETQLCDYLQVHTW